MCVRLDDSTSGMSGPLNVCAMTFEQTETATNIIFGTGSGQIYRSALPYKPNYPPINQVLCLARLCSRQGGTIVPSMYACMCSCLRTWAWSLPCNRIPVKPRTTRTYC